MSRAFRSYKETLLKALTDPQEATAYLNAALEEGSREAFLLALRDVAEANGIARVAHHKASARRRRAHSAPEPQEALR